MASIPQAPTNMSFLFTRRRFFEAIRSPAPAVLRTPALFPALVITDSTPPSQPGTPVGTAASQTQIDWTWTASTDTGGSGLSGYRVYVDGSATPTTTVTTNSYSSTGHSAGTSHTLRVEAFDGAGNSISSGTGTQSTQSSGGGGGNLTHGASFTVTTADIVSGTGNFGTKSGNAPTVWDDCMHGQVVTARWDGHWPDHSDAAYNLDYRSTQRGVSPAHSNVSKYLCGAHTNGSQPLGYFSGYNVACWKSYVRPSFPYYEYWSWYERLDPNWVFNLNEADGNNKWFGLSIYGDIYGSTGAPNYYQDHWYLAGDAQVGGPAGLHNTTTVQACNIVDDSGGKGYQPFVKYGGSYTNPCSRAVKREVILKISNTSNQAITRVVIDNATLLDDTTSYNMGTAWDTESGGQDRSSGIGGYNRDYPNANNWRYFNDIYYDRQTTGLGRFVLTNNATYASATTVEIQPYTAWSATSVTLTCNKGKLSAGTVHLWYRDEAGIHKYLGPRTLN